MAASAPLLCCCSHVILIFKVPSGHFCSPLLLLCPAAVPYLPARKGSKEANRKEENEEGKGRERNVRRKERSEWGRERG